MDDHPVARAEWHGVEPADGGMPRPSRLATLPAPATAGAHPHVAVHSSTFAALAVAAAALTALLRIDMARVQTPTPTPTPTDTTHWLTPALTGDGTVVAACAINRPGTWSAIELKPHSS